MRSLLASFAFAVLLLAGCGGGTSSGISTSERASGVQQAVRQAYSAERVAVNVRQQRSGSLLEVVLGNPGGREATNRQSARTVAQLAREQYTSGSDGDAPDSVTVSFEFSNVEGPAEVGFHRRYTFAPGDLQGEAMNASTPADTTAAPDTSAS